MFCLVKSFYKLGFAAWHTPKVLYLGNIFKRFAMLPALMMPT